MLRAKKKKQKRCSTLTARASGQICSSPPRTMECRCNVLALAGVSEVEAQGSSMCPNGLIWEDSCFLGVGIVLLARPRLPLYLLSAFQRCAASVSLASLHPDPKSIPREDSLLGKCLATQKKHTHGIVLNPNSTNKCNIRSTII